MLAPPNQEQPGYSLGFIEFDDQGQLWSAAQIEGVLNGVNPLTSDDMDKRDYLMVVFVHGWKHNAGWYHDSGCRPDNTYAANPTANDEDRNVANFRTTLRDLSKAEIELSQKVNRPARRIIGIYLGWRGHSITPDYIDNLTFWDRKGTAHKVGHGQVTEVLERLDLMRRKQTTQDPHTHSRLVVVGHSFGGAVVFSAVEQILEARLLETNNIASTPVRGFGDLVVLLNPAFEAQLFSPLSNLSAGQKTYFGFQLPVLAILTSETDQATRKAFPLGRWFSTSLEKHRGVSRMNATTGVVELIDERQADVTAVGHFDPYITHTLRATQVPNSPAQPGTAQIGTDKARMLADASGAWEADKPGSEIFFPGSVLRRTANSAGHNPYLNIRVDKLLSKDHGDIWNDSVRGFITNLILISGQSDDPHERASRRKAAEQ